jgi:hypothetical protein
MIEVLARQATVAGRATMLNSTSAPTGATKAPPGHSTSEIARGAHLHSILA